MAELLGSVLSLLGLSSTAAGVLSAGMLVSGFLVLQREAVRLAWGKKMEQILETKKTNVDKAWEQGLVSWHGPLVPYIITAKNQDELNALGKVGAALSGELAFMKYPEFQIYQNLERIVKTFSEDPQRGLEAVSEHELGHRFCPYDSITLILLNHAASKELQGKKLPIDQQTASSIMLNLYSDMCINTRRTKQGSENIPWAYQQLSKNKSNSSFWRVYGRSMELSWGKQILPEGTQLSKKEEKAAEQLKILFEGDYFDRDRWKEGISNYTKIMSEFLEENSEKDNSNREKGKGKSLMDKIKNNFRGRKDESIGEETGKVSKGDKGNGESKENSGINAGFDDITKNIPSAIDDATARELARRVAEIGSDGMPTNSRGIEEFKEVMAGFGQGNPTQASIHFYDMLSNSYEVMFATQPFGRPRVNPFQPIKWTPAMGVDRLDIDYSAQVGGKIIPGVNTYAWNTRKREVHGGLEEVVPNLDIYLDSSMSMPNPIEEISLPVLVGFVASKKALRKGAKVRVTIFSGNGQHATQEFTAEKQKIFENLTTYYGGGTVFPTEKLLQEGDPKQVLIITDTFIANQQEITDAISQLRMRNKGNRVAIYAIHHIPDSEYLRKAGAEIIQGTTSDIFKRVIGKTDEVYSIK